MFRSTRCSSVIRRERTRVFVDLQTATETHQNKGICVKTTSFLVHYDLYRHIRKHKKSHAPDTTVPLRVFFSVMTIRHQMANRVQWKTIAHGQHTLPEAKLKRFMSNYKDPTEDTNKIHNNTLCKRLY